MTVPIELPLQARVFLFPPDSEQFDISATVGEDSFTLEIGRVGSQQATVTALGQLAAGTMVGQQPIAAQPLMWLEIPLFQASTSNTALTTTLSEPAQLDEALTEEFRATEIDWLQQHLGELMETYRGEWLAVDGAELIARATSLADLLELSRARGHPNPFVTAIPEETLDTFHG